MNRIYSFKKIRVLLQLTLATAILLSLGLQGLAQTAAGTDIDNVATATYTDGSSTNYNATSNKVTVTVAKVAGLEITPDGGSLPTVVPGQTGVEMDFTVTNTGNFTDAIKFLANGASFKLPSGLTATAITIDPSGTLGAPVNMPITGGTDVDFSLDQNESVVVRLTVSVDANAAAGASLTVDLGDASGTTNNDNAAADGSANEVATTTTTDVVNGLREAKGDLTVTVENDAQIQVELTASPGPISLGGNITYTTEACNVGQRDLEPFALNGVTAVWMIVPIPDGTEIVPSTVPAGTIYSTDALTTLPLAATWSSTAPSPASNVERIAYPVSTAAIAPGVCAPTQTYEVKVTTDNANTSIVAVAEGFGENSVGTTITDRSGDNTPNGGNGSGNLVSPLPTDPTVPGQGVLTVTTLQKVASVLIGPSSAANATGPTDNNDDFTNMSFSNGIDVADGGVTTAGDSVTFVNTLQNTGNSDDTFKLTAPTVPNGWTVEIFDPVSAAWVAVDATNSVDFDVDFGSSTDVQVRVTAPAGESVLTGYDTVINAESVLDSAVSNQTIDRVYTGFMKLTKTAVVDNQTGIGGATDAVPGAKINYSIVYENISSTGGSGSVTLTANNLVITDDGNAAPSNWAASAKVEAGSAADTNGGTIDAYTASSTVMKDTIPSVAAGASGTFSFNVVIN